MRPLSSANRRVGSRSRDCRSGRAASASRRRGLAPASVAKRQRCEWSLAPALACLRHSWRRPLAAQPLPRLSSHRCGCRSWTTRRLIATWRPSSSRPRRFARRRVAACRSPMPAVAASARWRTRRSTRRSSSWRESIACLAGAGLRNTELCRIDIRDVDLAHGTINVADAKTEAGVRKVDLSPMLRDELLAWRTSLDASTPESPFFRTQAGSRRDKDNINARVIRPAVPRANERRALRDLPPAAGEGDGAHFPADLHLDDVRRRRGDPLRHGPGRSRRLEGHPGDLRAGPQAPRSRADRPGFDHLLVGGGRGEPRTRTRAARRPAKRSKTAARRGRNPG